MSRFSVPTLFVMLMTAVPSFAQDVPRAPTRATVADLQRMLADLDLEATTGKTTDGKIDWIDCVRHPNRVVGRIYVYDDGATLNLGVSFPNLAGKVSLETINTWNALALHTRGSLETIKQKDGSVVRVPRVESDLDCGIGFTPRVFARFINRFENLTQKFVDHLVKNVDQAAATNSPPKSAEVAPVTRPAAELDLVGTTWVGTEDLANFGKLRFDFKADRTVIMIDATEKPVPCTWSRSGSQVVIEVSNARYTGTLQGTTLTGKGEFLNNAKTWNFIVHLQKKGFEPVPAIKDSGVKPSTSNSVPNRVPAAGGYQVAEVQFPIGATGSEVQTAWRVHYRTDPQHGLRIVGAWLKRPGENPEWLKVVDDLHISQFYVPYADNTNRFFDMDRDIFPQHAPWKLDRVFPGRDQLLGPSGRLLDDFTVREDRDDGLLWLFSDGKFEMMKQSGGPRAGKTFVNRRQAMVLWGVYQASNYFYVMHYAFHNDGVIQCRIGSTGKNLPGHRKESGHMHNGLWRVQMNLGTGAFESSVAGGPQDLFVLKHEERREGQGKGAFVLYPIQQEGSVDWVPEEFTALRFRSPTLKNLTGGNVTYDLVPLRHGNARHYAPQRKQYGRELPSDEFMHHDFWVTNNDPRYSDFRLLPQYTSAGTPLRGQPVIWHVSSNLHLPRDEDFIGLEKSRVEGCATVMFSGFDLRPKSVFSGTPLLKSSLFLTP